MTNRFPFLLIKKTHVCRILSELVSLLYNISVYTTLSMSMVSNYVYNKESFSEHLSISLVTVCPHGDVSVQQSD